MHENQRRRAEFEGTLDDLAGVDRRVVNGAALLLYPASGTAEPITIPVTQDGNFTIADVPLGEYKIVVEGTAGVSQVPHGALQNVPPEKRAEAEKKLAGMNTPPTIAFPDRYKSLQTTDLKCTVTDKAQTLNLELKD